MRISTIGAPRDSQPVQATIVPQRGLPLALGRRQLPRALSQLVALGDDLVECVDGFKVGVSAIRHHDAEDGRQERIRSPRELVRLAHLSNIVGNYYEVPSQCGGRSGIRGSMPLPVIL